MRGFERRAACHEAAPLSRATLRHLAVLHHDLAHRLQHLPAHLHHPGRFGLSAHHSHHPARHPTATHHPAHHRAHTTLHGHLGAGTTAAISTRPITRFMESSLRNRSVPIVTPR